MVDDDVDEADPDGDWPVELVALLALDPVVDVEPLEVLAPEDPFTLPQPASTPTRRTHHARDVCMTA
jgi:hypothetical protein